MTNYEAIKQMSLEEMAAMLYFAVKPMLDYMEATEAQRKEVQKGLREVLATEVKGSEGTN